MANLNKSSSRASTHTVDKFAPGLNKIFLGEVMSSRDVSFTGRLLVFIPELSSDKEDVNNYVNCLWASPFAGAVNATGVGDNIPEPADSMQSYGLWMVPPDAGTLVLVTFLNGDMAKPVAFGCLFPDRLNYMVPGHAASRTYGSADVPLPSTEKNKRVEDIDHDNTTRPVHYQAAEAIVRQGLARDARRGAGFSTARRESPSEVFGLLTPGPKDPNRATYRLGGHQLIFDDNLSQRLVRVRTAGGQQILLDDVAGSIYMINKDGQAWWEIDAKGNFTVFAEGSVNLRARGHFNLRADRDINIEAGGDVKIKAAGDTESRDPGSAYVGPNQMGQEPRGYGGRVMVEAASSINTLASQSQIHEARSGNMEFSAGRNVNMLAQTVNVLGERDIKFTASGTVSVGANGSILLTARGDMVTQASAIRLNSGGASAEQADQAQPAAEIPTSVAQDQPMAKPEFSRNATNSLPTGGRRPGSAVDVSTIVAVMPTAEPYAGHDVYDPTSEDIGSIEENEQIAQSLPPGSNGVVNSQGDMMPNDVDTPNGFARAIGPVGQDGAIVTTQNVRGGLPSNFELVGDGTPLSNFQPANAKTLARGKLAEVANTLQSATGQIAGRARDLAGRALAGAGHIMTQAQESLGAIAILPNGETASGFDTRALAPLAAALTSLRSSSNRAEAVQELSQQGILVEQDGDSVLLTDQAGNIIVDVANGTGPRGTDMVHAGDLLASSHIVKRYVRAEISDNQMAALSSFAGHVGENNFARSGITEAVNQGRFSEVPRLMMAFSMGSRGAAGADAVYREDYASRRMFEGELFSTPDTVPLPATDAQVSFEQLAQRLRAAKQATLGGTSRS
jgi:GH24 family phage-related lysozyme (muramidase)